MRSPASFLRLAAAGCLLAGVACSAPAGAVPPTPAPAQPSVGASSVPAAAPVPSANVAQGASGKGDTLQGLIDAARAEGELDLTWSADTAGGADGADQWIAGFNQTYGLNLKVQFTPGPSMPDVGSQITQQYQSNRPASSDIMIGAEPHITDMYKADVLLPEDWAAWAPNIQDPQLLAPDGVAVAMGTRLPGITYNSDLLTGDAIPKSLEDLLKPEYKGKIASTIYAANFDRMASPELWGEERTNQYISQLAGQISGLIRCGEVTRIISGEFDAYDMDCGGYDAINYQRKGAPVGQVIPSDMALIVYWYMGVPKNSAHPAAAKLFINYVMGRAGQDVLWDSDAVDNHLVPGSHTAQLIDQYQQQGVVFHVVDVQFVLRNDETKVDAIRKHLQDLLSGKA